MNIDPKTLGLIILTIVGAPIVGGILTGVDRRLTARLQSRIGPPIFQPFYDVLKLISKGSGASHKVQLAAAWFGVLSMAISLVLMVLGQDLLVTVLVVALGSISLVLGGFSVRSPYSQLGSQRELMQILAYEPLLLFLVVAVYLKTGSFMVSRIYELEQPLLFSLPLFVVTMIIVMGIKLRKSPFDTAASHHAHQEVVRGILTEFSGTSLALIEVMHWYELIVLLSFIAIFWATPVFGVPVIGGVLLSLICYFVVILIDNVTARMTWAWTVRLGWHLGVPLSVANLVALYAMLKS